MPVYYVHGAVHLAILEDCLHDIELNCKSSRDQDTGGDAFVTPERNLGADGVYQFRALSICGSVPGGFFTAKARRGCGKPACVRPIFCCPVILHSLLGWRLYVAQLIRHPHSEQSLTLPSIRILQS